MELQLAFNKALAPTIFENYFSRLSLRFGEWECIHPVDLEALNLINYSPHD